MRRPSFRLTFLWRFTLVTLVLSFVSALVLTSTMERAQQETLAMDLQASTLGRVGAELAAPLDALSATGRVTPATRSAFARAAYNADLFESASNVRVYRSDGQAVYPSDTPPAPADVHRALTEDSLVRVARAGKLTAYVPSFTRGNRAYVIAADFSKPRLAAADEGERSLLLRVEASLAAITFVALLALAAGASRELERRRRESESSFIQLLGVMADVIDLRDPGTAGHARRVCVYTRKLATAIGLSERQIETYANGALLHDIGKIGIPDSVLGKPAALDRAERAIIADHTVIGARFLGSIGSMAEIVPCVRHHHERIDGTGYPDRLAGENIPLGARLIAVCDTFDAMTSDRPYRAGLSIQTAIEELTRVAGTQLDERLVYAFVKLIVDGDIVRPRPVAAREVDVATDR